MAVGCMSVVSLGFIGVVLATMVAVKLSFRLFKR